MLFKGKCLLSYHCRARKVQSGSMKGLGCKCSNLHCHNCQIYGEGGQNGERGSEECLICRDDFATMHPSYTKVVRLNCEHCFC